MISVKSMAVTLLLACLSGSSCARSSVPANNTGVVRQVNALARDFEAGNIESIEITQISLSKVFVAAVSPKALDRIWDSKITIRHDLSLRCPKVATTLRAAVITESSSPGDLRWKFAFYSSEGNQLGLFYFDAFGKRGLVGDVPVSYKTDFLFRLRRAIDPSSESFPGVSLLGSH